MAYMTKKADQTGKTPVEVYMEKQKAWAEAQDAWDAAKILAKSKNQLTNPGLSSGSVAHDAGF